MCTLKQTYTNIADDLVTNSQILIVDDDESICKILSQYLKSREAICTITTNPLEAVEEFKKTDFDVIISDIYMPNFTGHELLELAIKYRPITPVILMTGSPSLDNTIEAIRLGAYDYMVKPFNLDMVSFTVERALEYRNLAVENQRYQEHLEQIVAQRTQELSDFMFHAVQSLSLALEARDPYTEGHGFRVSLLMIKIAKVLGIDETYHTALRLSAMLHDIGKIGIPDNILQKPGKLTAEEYDIMKKHVEIGYKILSPIPSLKDVSRYVYEHHERLDGKGYPRGLSGNEIHFHSRILQVTEVFDALATPRVYKPAWPVFEIMNYFEEQSGTGYDTDVVNALLHLLEKEGDEIMKIFDKA